MAIIEQFRQDVLYAARSLRQSPGFTAIATITLVLGISATTALFSIVNAVLLRSLPYFEPDRLVHVLSDDPRDSRSGVPWRAFAVMTSQDGPFSGIAAYYRNTGWSRVTIGGTQQPETAQAGFTTEGFFSTLGVLPSLGRVFNEDEVRHREPLAVLSEPLWQRRFNSDPSAIGSMIDIDGRAFTVIGVMPRSFQFPARETQLWLPITTNRYWDDQLARDGVHGRGYYMRWNVVGRLQAHVTTGAVARYVDRIGTQLAHEDPDWNIGLALKVVPLGVEITGNTRLGLLVLFGSACLVLLIGCANIANLLLARGAGRLQELSVRAALGATQGRIIRQILTESLVLVAVSACGAVVLARAAIRVLVLYGPADLPRLDETNMDWRVLCFAIGVSGVAAIFFAIVPALRAGRTDPGEYLKQSGRTSTDSKATVKAGAVLIVFEFAFAVVLLVGSGLLIRSLQAVEGVRLGFVADNVLTLQIRLPDGATPADSAGFEQEVLSRMSALPGVEYAGGIKNLFELGQPPENSLRAVEGRPQPRDSGALTWTTVSGEYFRAMGIPLLAGSDFSEHDNAGSPLVAIIDEAMASRYWLRENAVGKRFKGQDSRGTNDDWLTVIGVVANARRQGLEQEPTPHVYEWHRQAGAVGGFVIRTRANPAPLANSIRAAVRQVEPHAVVSGVMSMREHIESQTAARRFQTWLLGLFAVVAMILSTVGIYGVMSYATARRTHEIGVRIAVGATRKKILTMVLRSGLVLAFSGLGAGVAAALAVTRILSGLLYGITPTDPLTFAAVALVLLFVGATATLVPAWRATRVDPLVTLRSA
jgi:putative ABC transport system permease protein